MFDPVATKEKHGFDTATSDAFDTLQSVLKIKMLTVQVNGNEFARDDNGDLLIKACYPMPASVGADSDPDAHVLDGQ
ncbi:MAG: hypothetical protein ACRDTN_01675 [Mycobacterium sp.]